MSHSIVYSYSALTGTFNVQTRISTTQRACGNDVRRSRERVRRNEAPRLNAVWKGPLRFDEFPRFWHLQWRCFSIYHIPRVTHFFHILVLVRRVFGSIGAICERARKAPQNTREVDVRNL